MFTPECSECFTLRLNISWGKGEQHWHLWTTFPRKGFYSEAGFLIPLYQRWKGMKTNRCGFFFGPFVIQYSIKRFFCRFLFRANSSHHTTMCRLHLRVSQQKAWQKCHFIWINMNSLFSEIDTFDFVFGKLMTSRSN